MNKKQVDLCNNIDVFILSNGRKATVKKYIDIKIAESVAVRVCLVEDIKTCEQFLYLDKQLVAAFEKHETETLNSYNLVWFYDDEQKGQEQKIIGDGNLIPQLFQIIGRIKNQKLSVNKVMILVQRALSITV